MSATVRIPTILRTYTGGEAEVTATGATLQEVINDLEAQFPGIAARVLDDNGVVHQEAFGGVLEQRPFDKLAVPVAVPCVGVLSGAADLDCPRVPRAALGQVPALACREQRIQVQILAHQRMIEYS